MGIYEIQGSEVSTLVIMHFDLRYLKLYLLNAKYCDLQSLIMFIIVSRAMPMLLYSLYDVVRKKKSILMQPVSRLVSFFLVRRRACSQAIMNEYNVEGLCLKSGRLRKAIDVCVKQSRIFRQIIQYEMATNMRQDESAPLKNLPVERTVPFHFLPKRLRISHLSVYFFVFSFMVFLLWCPQSATPCSSYMTLEKSYYLLSYLLSTRSMGIM